jgi:hypothetical protein
MVGVVVVSIWALQQQPFQIHGVNEDSSLTSKSPLPKRKKRHSVVLSMATSARWKR